MIPGLLIYAARLYYEDRHPRKAIRVVVEPNLDVIYGTRGGARIEGTVTERWGKPYQDGFTPNDHRRVTTVDQAY